MATSLRQARLADFNARRELVRYPPAIPSEIWRTLTAYERMAALYGNSLEVCRVALAEWPLDPTDLPRLNFQDKVRHDVMMIVAKAGLNERERQRQSDTDELERIADALRAYIEKGNVIDGAAAAQPTSTAQPTTANAQAKEKVMDGSSDRGSAPARIRTNTTTD